MGIGILVYFIQKYNLVENDRNMINSFHNIQMLSLSVTDNKQSTCNIVRKLVVAQTTDTCTSKQSTNTSNIFTTTLKVLKVVNLGECVGMDGYLW